MFKRMRICSVCHKESNQTVIGSTSTFGGCDLDTRPAPLARYLISSRIQTCPHCGYTNYDISNEVEGYDRKIKENEYKELFELKINSQALRYLKMGYVLDDDESKLDAYLNACWVCDDAKDNVGALYTRNKAIALILSLKDMPSVYYLILTDLYRRISNFTEAKRIAEYYLSNYQDNAFIAEYQLKLIEAKDDRCHSLNEI